MFSTFEDIRLHLCFKNAGVRHSLQEGQVLSGAGVCLRSGPQLPADFIFVCLNNDCCIRISICHQMFSNRFPLCSLYTGQSHFSLPIKWWVSHNLRAFTMLSAWNTVLDFCKSGPSPGHLTWHHPPFHNFISAPQTVTDRNLGQELHASRDFSCPPGLCGLLLRPPQLLAYTGHSVRGHPSGPACSVAAPPALSA